MFCLKCSEAIPDGSEICPKCGANLKKKEDEQAVIYASQKELEETVASSVITRTEPSAWKLSAVSTLDILCAIIIFVVFGISSANAFLIKLSVFVSTALVESSNINIFGFLSSALAIHNLCFCPPLTFVPPCSI